MKLLLSIIIGFVAVNAAFAVRGKKIVTWKENGGDIEQLRPNEMSRHPGALRNALKRTSEYKWDNLKNAEGNFVVPYTISGNPYQADELKVLKLAMKEIEDNTCIRYKERTNEKDFLSIENSYNDGCFTTVGRRRGENRLQLEATDLRTCMHHEIVIHELLHSLGLWHEHMRFDRDDYIKVHHENIVPGAESQFRLIGTEQGTTYGEPYDYTSVMHYPSGAFGKNGKDTMEPKQRQYLDVIGMAKTASPVDYRKICNIYQCSTCSGKSYVPSDVTNGPDATTTRATLAPKGPGGSCTDRAGSACVGYLADGFCDNKNYGESTKKRLCAKSCNLC